MNLPGPEPTDTDADTDLGTHAPEELPQIGRLNEPSAVRRLEWGGTRFTYVVDGTMLMLTDKFFPAIPRAYWSDHPEAVDAGARVVMAAGGLLVERDGLTLLLDAGYGDAKATSGIGGDVVAITDCGALPDTLAALGTSPSDIDAVAFTHLHIDHTGWAFVKDDADGTGAMRPFFPRARYLVAAREWEPHEHGVTIPGAPTREAVLEPLAHHHTAFEDGEELFPGVHALVTPGHSPGHTSFVVTTDAGRLIMFGDAFHIPAQIQRPDWPSLPDVDGAAVLKARARLVEELEQSGTIGLGCHFGDQAFGRIVRDADGAPAWHPIPATPLFPTPRPSLPVSQ
jgi:glyoxylase-like metal-dependent hydrolase (beta-lactamase superfamily II)